MAMIKSFLSVLCLTTIAGCGQPLGEYQIEAVRVVTEAPLPEGVRATPFGRYLKVTLSSETSLTAISEEIDGVYAHADFCPFTDRYSLTTFGPFGSNDEDLGVPNVVNPMKKDSDGKFHYTVFIVPEHPMANVEYSETALNRESYNLGVADRDVCLRLDAPGYNIIPSKSEVVRIPRQTIKAALSSAS